jgi:hypothetical protein
MPLRYPYDPSLSPSLPLPFIRYLIPYGSFTASETIVYNQPLSSLANGINYTIPSNIVGQFWIASVKRVTSWMGMVTLQLNGYAPRNTAGWQSNTANPMLTVNTHCASITLVTVP